MDSVGLAFGSRSRYERAQRLARAGSGPLAHVPGPLAGWTAMRELPEFPEQSFREWWAQRSAAAGDGAAGVDPPDTAGRSHGAP
jgi:L-lactate dehydrogenase complex protein LldF